MQSGVAIIAYHVHRRGRPTALPVLAAEWVKDINWPVGHGEIAIPPGLAGEIKSGDLVALYIRNTAVNGKKPGEPIALGVARVTAVCDDFEGNDAARRLMLHEPTIVAAEKHGTGFHRGLVRFQDIFTDACSQYDLPHKSPLVKGAWFYNYSLGRHRSLLDQLQELARLSGLFLVTNQRGLLQVGGFDAPVSFSEPIVSDDGVNTLDVLAKCESDHMARRFDELVVTSPRPAPGKKVGDEREMHNAGWVRSSPYHHAVFPSQPSGSSGQGQQIDAYRLYTIVDREAYRASLQAEDREGRLSLSLRLYEAFFALPGSVVKLAPKSPQSLLHSRLYDQARVTACHYRFLKNGEFHCDLQLRGAEANLPIQ